MPDILPFLKLNISKSIGETPLEALERVRGEYIFSAQSENDEKLVNFWRSVPMTYAGRLDPMAEGELLILIGDECKHKEKYLGLDKEYEVDIAFGIETDSYDMLGIPKMSDNSVSHHEIELLDLSKYVKKFSQEYPPFSSKTVKGKQLHALAREDALPDEMPRKEVEIYSLQKLKTYSITGNELLVKVLSSIKKVKGDFRQQEIMTAWRNLLENSHYSGREFQVMSARVNCSSGTYMRSLAHQMGKDSRSSAFALRIRRTKIISSKKL